MLLSNKRLSLALICSYFFPTEGEKGINSLPHDVLRQILILVPAKTLHKLRYVSKYWNKTISDPWFIKHHLYRWRSLPLGCIIKSRYFKNNTTGERFRLRLQDIFCESRGHVLLDSCDGLLLLGVFDEVRSSRDTYHIVNPVTRFSTKVPSPPEEFYDYLKLVFDDTIDQYKILAWYQRYDDNYDFEDEGNITGSDEDEHVVFRGRIYHSGIVIPGGHTVGFDPPYHELSVLTLGGTNTTSWRKLRLPEHCTAGYTPVVCGRKMYWVSYNESAERHMVLSLDIASENIEKIGMPNHNFFDLSMRSSLRLMVIRGSLYLVYGSLDNHCYIIWILEDMENQIWTKLHQKKFEMNHESCSCSSNSDYIMVRGCQVSAQSEIESLVGSVSFYNSKAINHFNSLGCLENIQSGDGPTTINSSIAKLAQEEHSFPIKSKWGSFSNFMLVILSMFLLVISERVIHSFHCHV